MPRQTVLKSYSPEEQQITAVNTDRKLVTVSAICTEFWNGWKNGFLDVWPDPILLPKAVMLV